MIPPEKRSPIRTCVVCGRRERKSELHRFVWGQQGRPEWDQSQVAAGRGAYCCRSEKCLERFENKAKKWKRVFRL